MRKFSTIIATLVFISVASQAHAGFSDETLKKLSQVQNEVLGGGQVFTAEMAMDKVWPAIDNDALAAFNAKGIDCVQFNSEFELVKFKAVEKDGVIQFGSVKATCYEAKTGTHPTLALNYILKVYDKNWSTVHVVKWNDSLKEYVVKSTMEEEFGIKNPEIHQGVLQIGEYPKGCITVYHTPNPSAGGARSGLYVSKCDTFKIKYKVEDVDNPVSLAKPKRL